MGHGQGDGQVSTSHRDIEKPFYSKKIACVVILSKLATQNAVNLMVYTKSALEVQLYPNSEHTQKKNSTLVTGVLKLKT